MKDVVIVAAARTPVGRFRGSLKEVRADHLGALVINQLLARSGVEARQVDDVVFGCVTQVGEQCGNIARMALLAAGWPETIPGMTVDRKCGSSEAALHVAVGEIAAGACDVVVAGGAENMTRVPMGGNRDVHGEPCGWRVKERFALTSQGEAAERLCDEWGLTRDQLDTYAFESHRRAAHAADSGWFDRETVAVETKEWAERGSEPAVSRLERDETIRRDTSREKLATLTTSFRENGRVTAGNASQISDGAAALLLMSSDKARELGLRARARIRAIATVGSDPVLMLTGPIAATRKVAARADLALDQIDLFEVNEAFAPVPLVWMKELGVGHDRLNVNGGAIALGHPLGASGARIATTLLHELERREARFGLQAICCAGGLGTATLIERLP
jgi:acetyl-CoA acyltransferase